MPPKGENRITGFTAQGPEQAERDGDELKCGTWHSARAASAQGLRGAFVSRSIFAIPLTREKCWYLPILFSRVLRRINVRKEIERWLGIVFNVKGTGTTRNTQGMCYSSCIQIMGSQQPAAGFVMKIVPTPNENSLFSWTALSKDRMGVVLILNIHLCVCVIFSTRLVVKPWIGQIGRDSFPCTVFVPRL